MHDSKDATSGSKRIMLTIPAALLKQADELAACNYYSRSGLIRQALVEYLNKLKTVDKPLPAVGGRDVELERFLEDFKEENPAIKL